MVTVQTDNVVSDLQFDLLIAGAERLKVAAHVSYDTRDPFAVSVSFEAGDGQRVEWTFARDLLDQGLWQEIGDGDVKVWPHAGAIFLSLCSPSGKAILETRRPGLADFMARIQCVVPVGQEADHVDFDRELESLLS